jgi:hypothetical protein
MTGTTPDYDEIVRVAQLYIKGFNERDVDAFKEAFHESAWMSCTGAEGTLHRSNLHRWIDENATGPKSNIVGRVISVQQAGEVACVLLGFDNVRDLSQGWVDFHALLKLDGVWKIMNKTATHGSRAAWAAPHGSIHQENAVAPARG